MKSLVLHLKTITVIFVFSALTACGGGGGGGSDTENDPFTLSTETLTFTAASLNSHPSPHSISGTITGLDSNTTLYIKIEYSGAVIESIGPVHISNDNSGSTTVYPSQARDLGPGLHTGTITVTACTSDIHCLGGGIIGSPQTVNVFYHVHGIVASTSQLDYLIENVTSPGDFSSQIDLTVYPEQDITVSSDTTWLTATPNSGTTAEVNQITALLDQAAIDNMNNGLYEANLTVSFSSGQSLVVPVSMRVSRTQVNFVAPYIGVENVSGDVIIRGDNFTAVTIQNVLFDATAALSFNVVSDSEIHATFPALPTGNYAITLENDLNANRSFANLVITTSKSYSAGTLSYPSVSPQILAIEYDAEREAIFVVASEYDGINFNTSSRISNRIVKYRFNNGIYAGMTSRIIPLLQDIALSPDGDELIAITDNSVVHLDPDTLNALSQSFPTNRREDYLKDIAILNNGSAYITTGISGSGSSQPHIYSLIDGSFNTYVSSECGYFATPAVSGDGSLAVLIEGPLSPAQPLCSFSSSVNSRNTLPINAKQTSCMNSAMGKCRPPALDKTASRLAVLDITYTVRIYDQEYNLLGTLPDQHGVVLLSPDGTRAYTYHSNSVLRTFDLSAPTVNGIFQEIGTGTTLAGDPGDALDFYPPNPDQVVRMTLSHDGQTLFIAGSNQVVIQPVP